jgi:methylase of polypeptide subunit release factors
LYLRLWGTIARKRSDRLSGLVTVQVLKTPTADLRRLAQLSDHLAAIGFTEDGIRGAISGAPSADPWSFSSREVGGDGSPLSVAARLFCLGVPIERRQVEAAFNPVTVSDLEALGLVEIDGPLVRPVFTIRPADGLLVTSDLPSSHPDVVLGAVPASETLAKLTLRHPAARAFDLGTGCGVQALFLARHAAEVTAVDINPRALALATFNAALNGLANVQVRSGSWFAPVDGQRFDIIACNPPYVISPDTSFTYRDGGLTRDEVSRMVVRESAAHLADGGFATVLCNWIHDGDWAAAIRPWVEGTGCDAIFLHYATLDPKTYAMRWNTELRGRDLPAFEATVRRWLDYFRRERIEQIAFGGVILRRRSGAATHWVRALAMADGPTGACSDQILRLFDAADFLESPAGKDLLGHAYTLVEGHTVNQALAFRDGQYGVAPAIFQIVPGLGLDVPVDARALEVLFECGAGRTLGDIISAIARDRGEPDGALAALLLPAVRQLIEAGFMIPVPDGKQGG